MILTALKDLADAEGLIPDPDYEPKPVTHVVELASTGKLLRITDIRELSKKGKPKAVLRLVPKTSGRTSGIAAQFLYDKSDYALGIKKNKEGSISLTDDRLGASLELIERAARESKDEGLAAVQCFLQTLADESDRAERLAQSVDPQDLNGLWFVFRLHGDDGFVSTRPKVREWWKRERASTSTDATATCLITGQPCVPVKKHDLIKNLRGGSTSGVSIVTFNSKAFESYGLERNSNAPISQRAAEAYVRALNRLLSPAWPKPGIAGESLPNRRVILNDNTTVVFWTEDPSNDFADLFNTLFDNADEDTVRRLFESPKRGVIPYMDDKTAFYVLTLSGGQGRATIRGWLSATVAEMAARMQHWFDDLSLESGLQEPPRPSIKALLRSIAALGKDENIAPSLAAEVFNAILCGQPLPISLMNAAIGRNKAEGPGGSDVFRAHLRMQLLKATLLRLKRAHPDSFSHLPEVFPMLDSSNTSPAYRLGRLFAVLEKLQGAAQGQTNATIGDRFYGAASTAPATAFPRLLALSRHHLSKLEKEKPGWAVNLDRLLGEILDGIPADRWPAVLAMEEQGLFALGYYHQRQSFFRKKDDSEPELDMEVTA